MPNHVDCCSKRILKWIKKEIPKVALNLMDQYIPEYIANLYADVNMRLTKHEYEKIINMAKILDLHLI
jgi:putative pyruvate formate lyase activating enzyme